ncbi:peptidyl-prolyl cis-trans isomerase [Helicobacter cholecystus]|uniref:Peptidyl-prolyl cis-trans isomerase n=2 Tax=Helicobacter cholecystus TaxID=45498 RepID=A0A3D8IYB4_9HELI|nr:peptidyl-prolyl cis-trans isomerase [Helicobacter cholecystus]
MMIVGLRAENIIDGIAFKVNNAPVTLYELKSLQKSKNISEKEAKKELILKVIKAQEAQRLQIVADETMIDQQIQEAASMKGISRDEFVANMISSGYSYEELRAFYKNYIQEQLLTQRILSTNLKIVDEQELKKFYDSHQKDFTLPQEVVVIQYASNNEKLLAQAMNNPLMQIRGVDKREDRISLLSINPQIAQLFADTPKGKFTQILNNGGAVVAFYVKDKIGSSLLPYDQIKPMIMQKVVYARKDKILQEYFERLLASAIITNIRE